MRSRKFSFQSRFFQHDWLPEGHGERLWRRIESARRERDIPVRRAWALTVVAALVAALTGFWVLGSSGSGILRFSDGRELPSAIDVVTATSVALSDGSRIDAVAGSHLDVLESGHHVFGLALRRGTAVFDVRPGGPRTWRIECGAVTVEVVGTRFSVRRSESSVSVAVERGAVLVRGDPVPDRVVRLGAGQSLTVPLSPGKVATDIAAPRPDLGLPISSANPVSGNKTEPSEPARSARQMSPPGQEAAPFAKQNGSASSEPSAIPVPGTTSAPSTAAFAPTETTATPPTIEALLAAADAARESGRFTEAANLLEHVLSDHGGDPHAALTEFSLGRLYLESLSNAPKAASHFAGAIARRLPTGLDEDARARLVEALSRSGNMAAARDAAATYRALYPNGRRSHDIDRWLSAAR